MKNFFCFIALIVATMFASCNELNPNPVITIVHTNDTHSQIDPSSKGFGGVVERASIIEALRNEDPSLMYLDCGDMVQGSPYFNIYKGEVEILAMNKQGLEATTMGNHEFDNGLNGLAEMYNKADFPVLSCNYDCEGTPIEPYIKRKMIIERNGVKIGLTGVTCNPEGLIFNSHWAGIKYQDPVEAANKVAEELRAEGCDLVILLSHEGYDRTDSRGDRRIALNSKNIDLIIGGHSHTNIEEGEKLENAEGKPIWITQTGGKANPIGYVQMVLKRSAEKGRNYEIQDITIKKLYAKDFDLTDCGAEIKDFIAPYAERLNAMMGEVIGQSEVTMGKGRPQSLLGNFTADAFLKMGERYYGRKMDVAIMNNGGLRSDLDKGDVTIGTMFQIWPFENTLTILELKGEYLEKAINGLAGKKLEAMAGTQITLKTENDKTVATKILVGGKPIDPNRIYYVATIDYLAEGNGGLSALTYADKTTNTGILLRDVMTEYVKELTASGKTLTSKLDNRVIEL